MPEAPEAKPASPKPEPKAEPKRVLAHVSTSGQADVHHLVAERIAAEGSGDPALLAAVDAKLADLGFTV